MQTLLTQLVPVTDLKPHEQISEENYQVVLQDILNDRIIYNPLFIDKTTKVILDGHHRYTVAKRLNFLYIPCLLIDYFNDDVMSVFPRREDIKISKQRIIQAGTSGNLFPNKTSRHVLHAPYTPRQYSLDMLTSVPFKHHASLLNKINYLKKF